MADAPNTVSTLNGLFKTVYAEKLIDLVPDYAILQKKVDFVSAEKETGNFYAQPVNLSHEAGFTYNGESGAVVTLNDAKAGAMKEAQVKGTELILRSQLSYTALSRASKQGPKAFRRASAWKVEDMNNSTRKRLEVGMLYGQSSIGRVSGAPSGNVITISAATWAGGIWAGAEGAQLQAFTAISGASTEHNGGGADLTITAVDSDARTITVTNDGDVADGDYLFFKGAATTSGGNIVHSEMAGLQKIITNTGSLFNIDASAYSLWKGTSVTGVGQISHAKIQDALAKAVNKGLMEGVLLLCSPKAFGVLNSDQAALRAFDSSFSSSQAVNGAESLVFHSVNGKCEVMAHPMVKDGDLFIVPMDSVMRIGSVDLTFGVPGMEEDFFTLVSTKNAVELQCMADQAIFLEKPAHAVMMSGITYS